MMKSTLSALVACLLAAPATLHAQQAKAPAGVPPMAPKAPLLQRYGQRVDFVVDEQNPGLAGGAFDVLTHHLVVTDLWFSEDIETVMSASNATPAPSQYYVFKVTGRRMTIMPTAAAVAQGIPTSIAVRTQSMAVSLAVRVTQKPEDALSLGFVRKRSEVEAGEARQAAIDQQLAKDGVLRRFLAMRAAPIRPEIVLGDVAPQGRRGSRAPDITISNIQASWTGPDEMLLKFELENTGDTEFEWADARAYGQDPERNHVGSAQSELPPERASGLVARLPAGERVWAGILVENARDITGPMTILLRDQGGGRTAMAIVDHWVPMPMQTEFFVQRFQPVPPPDLEEGKVSLHLQGIYGAAWLGDGTGAELSDATSMTGLGVRAQYAFNRYLAVEGEVMGARTGTAHFEGVTYEGTQGDLARSATLGRAQFGGVLRLGKDTYVPILRLGLGLQGASHDGTLTTATGDAPGPDAFAVSALVHFGTGLNLRLGNHLVAGFTLSSALLAKTTAPDIAAQISLEAGIHLGYAWTP